MRHWPFVAIFLANLLMAVTLFWAGRLTAQTSPYSGCKLVEAGQVVFYACPVRRDQQPVRQSGDGEA